jgi:hypothetical protein
MDCMRHFFRRALDEAALEINHASIADSMQLEAPAYFMVLVPFFSRP